MKIDARRITKSDGKDLTDAVMSESAEFEVIQVLHVDDDRGFLKTACEILELHEFEVDTATTVEKALRKLKERCFDAVVSDYQMTGRDGLEFLEALRTGGYQVPFVMFTGKGREEVAMRALNLGADRYLQKHGDPETVYGELAHSIRKAVKGRRMEKALYESERKYRLLAENITDVIFIEDMNFNIKYVTPSVEPLFGYSPEEILKRKEEKIMTPNSFERAIKFFEEAVSAAEEQGDFEMPLVQYKFVRKDGSTFWGEVTGKFLQDHRGRLVGVQKTLREITQRKEAEEKLRERYGSYLTKKMCEVYGWTVREDGGRGQGVRSSH